MNTVTYMHAGVSQASQKTVDNRDNAWK